MNTVDEPAAWYEEWFDRAEYEIVYRNRDEDDARRLIELIVRVSDLPAGSRVLDMACGRGRHSLALARHGFEVTGIDLSDRAIATARRLANEQGVQVEFEKGDMRNAPCTSCFDLVVNLFTSFGYFEDDYQNERAIGAMAQALKHDGWFAQDFMNGRYWSTNFVPYDERVVDGIRLKQRRWVDRDRLKKEITIEHDDGSERRFIESVRLYDLADFRRIYASAGLEIVEIYGGSDGRPYDHDSRRLVMFARKMGQQ